MHLIKKKQDLIYEHTYVMNIFFFCILIIKTGELYEY